jgi:hypothetical protein
LVRGTAAIGVQWRCPWVKTKVLWRISGYQASVEQMIKGIGDLITNARYKNISENVRIKIRFSCILLQLSVYCRSILKE